MKKKLFALFLALVMVLSLAACSDPEPSTDSGSDPGVNTNSASDVSSDTGSLGTETDAATDSSSDASTETQQNTNTNSQQNTNTDSQVSSSDSSDKTEDVQKPFGYDPDLDHKVILTDNVGTAILVLDLDNGSWGNLDWKANPDLVVAKIQVGDLALDSARYRYSSYYGKDVIIATSSDGKFYIYEYTPDAAVCKQLFRVTDSKANEQEISLYNAHSAEILPNGDVVIATSGYQKDGDGSNYRNGGIHYYPAGSKKRAAFLSLPFAHGVVWDDKNQCLWSVGFEGIVAIKIKGSGENVTMEKIKGKGYKASKEFHGHDLVPAYGLDGKYWVSDGEAVYLFDTATNKLTKAKEYNYENIKGIAYFEDGTTVLSDWTPYFVTHVVDPLTQKTTKYPSALPGKVYKVNVFTKNYQ